MAKKRGPEDASMVSMELREERGTFIASRMARKLFLLLSLQCQRNFTAESFSFVWVKEESNWASLV